MKSFSKTVNLSIVVCALLFPLSTVHAASAKYCGQTLNYNPTIPASNVPKAFSTFSGIWKGRTIINTESSNCIAFAVEKVESSGRVAVQQAWGVDDSSGSWAVNAKNTGATKNAWIGQISNGTLVLAADTVNYQLSIDPANPNKMVGEVHDPIYGTFKVELYRTVVFQ